MLSYQGVPQAENGVAILGLGGAGSNVLQCFASSQSSGVQLFSMSLDERIGRGCPAEFIQLGRNITHGMGSGGDPEVGRRAAMESETQIKEMLRGLRLLVLVVGLGGGTGSGVSPVLTRLAREAGVFLVTVAVMPFDFEGARRRSQAEAALRGIRESSHIVFCFENDYMEGLFASHGGAHAVFAEADRLLARATASVPMLASSPGLINLGLDELLAVLDGENARCIFGLGVARGKNRAAEAIADALASPLMSYESAYQSAKRIIVHVSGGESLALHEIREVGDTLRRALSSQDVEIFLGAAVKPQLEGELRVMLIASIDAKEIQSQKEARLEAEKVVELAASALISSELEMPQKPASPRPDLLAVELSEDDATEDAWVEPALEVDPEIEPEQEVDPESDDDDYMAESDESRTRYVSNYADDSYADEAYAPKSAPAKNLMQGSLMDIEQGTAAVSIEDLGLDDEALASIKPAAMSSSSLPDDDDLDTPPSLRYHDVRNLYPSR